MLTSSSCKFEWSILYLPFKVQIKLESSWSNVSLVESSRKLIVYFGNLSAVGKRPRLLAGRCFPQAYTVEVKRYFFLFDVIDHCVDESNSVYGLHLISWGRYFSKKFWPHDDSRQSVKNECCIKADRNVFAIPAQCDGRHLRTLNI